MPNDSRGNPIPPGMKQVGTRPDGTPEMAPEGMSPEAVARLQQTGNNPISDFWDFVSGKDATYSIPKASDYTAAAEKTAQQNRPDQTNAYGSRTTWSVGPDGRPVQTQSFGGPLAGANSALLGQLGQEYSTPFDMSKIPGLTDGASARDQAINAAYGQATSRLDPQFAQREEQTRTQLLNQGLDPGSEAYQTQMANFGRDRNDAYSSAMNGAISQGTAAGSALFGQSLAGHNSAMTDALTKRALPQQELEGLQGFLQQPGFQPGTNYLGATGMQDAATMGRFKLGNDMQTNATDSFLNLASQAVPFVIPK